MRRLGRHILCLFALTMTARASAGASAVGAVPGNVAIATVGTPAGFDELASARVVLVDFYFGGRKIGEALADARPGLLRFRSPAEVLAMVPELSAAPEVRSRFAGELPTNSSALCSLAKTTDCGTLAPEVIGIIYDEDRFRADIFVNPRFLRTAPSTAGDFLPLPTAPLSLTSAIGVAASGTVGGRAVYNIQNRTVLGFRNARVRTSNSLSSTLGWIVDDLAGEVDRKDLRYSAGLFWAPGSDFTGQRRIIGAGVGTQFDTLADPGAIQGTPLVVFLSQPARIELVVDGRLVTSRTYPAGNNELDTSGLSDGSYPVLVRIHEQNGSVRDERRFFVKNRAIAPAGHPLYFAYAGVLANSRGHRPVDASGTLFYQAGTARRVGNSLAFDLDVLGTQRKTILEAGGWLIARPARIRLAALGSTSGDAGVLLELASTAHGILNFNFDLRRIWSGDGKPLLPLPAYADTFESNQPIGAQLAGGSYTQAVGSIGLRLGNGNLSIVGTYRKDRGLRSDYSIGPSFNWPVAARNGLRILFELSGQRTRTTTAGFAGLRILAGSGAVSMSGTLGQGIDDDRYAPGGGGGRPTGSVAVQYSRQTQGGTVLTGDAGADRDVRTSSVRAGGTMSSRLGSARADLLHKLEGGNGTQYDLSFQSGLAVSAGSLTLGARQAEPSAIVVSVHGDAGDAQFTVLVDDVARGQVKAGQRLSLFVPGYRTYRVRLLPVGAAAVDFDASARRVTLYPGNVQLLDWTARSYFTLIAQAVAADGSPIADALVQTQKSVAETDGSGYFQIDVRRGDAITVDRHGPPACSIKLPQVVVHDDFASIGKVACQ